MIWLSGSLQNAHREHFNSTLGVMLSLANVVIPTLPARVPFAIDNGMYSDRFDRGRWEAYLERFRPDQGRCLFAVAPDMLYRERDATSKIVSVHGDPEATYARFWEYVPLLRSLAYRVAFVSQDRATRELIPWDDIDCLFVGGSDAWKLSDASVVLIREAQNRGLWTHMGRCQARGGIGGRIAAAHALGMDSGDGTVLARDPSRIGRVVRGLKHLNAQLALEAVS